MLASFIDILRLENSVCIQCKACSIAIEMASKRLRSTSLQIEAFIL